MQREVAKVDIAHLSLLRDNVSQFLKNSGTRFDNKEILVLDIAPQDSAGAKPYFPLAQVETLDIDPESDATYIADLCGNNHDVIKDHTFDVIVCTEVLEHTLKPFLAVVEISRILKPGGFALVSVPFNFRIHGPLPDCWRFTEHGLRSLFDFEAGFEIEELTPLEDPERFLMPVHYTMIARKI